MTIKKVLGIVGCQVLEDELSYIVASDIEVKNVLIIDETVQQTIAKKIQRLAPGKNVSCFDQNYDVKQFQLPNDMSVIIWLKPISLHQSPPLLREEVFKVVKKIEPLINSLLIFYGQCGKAFRNFEMLAQGILVPVTILRDKDGALIDDCYGTELGGNEEYHKFLIEQRGPSYMLNSMWAAHWRNFMMETQMLHDSNNVEEAKEIFKYMDYVTAVGLYNGLVDQTEFERQVEEFARIFDLQAENHRGTLKIVEHSYVEAKGILKVGGLAYYEAKKFLSSPIEVAKELFNKESDK